MCAYISPAVPTPNLKKTNQSAVITLSREDNDYDTVYVIVTLAAEQRKPDDIELTEVS